MKTNSICLVLPSLTSGGMERVMSELANEFVRMNIEVYFILLSKKPHFYELDQQIIIVEPDFTIEELGRIIFTVRNFIYLRRALKSCRAKNILTFGGRFNSFVISATLGLNKKVFVSNRSRPGISYGRFLDILNPMMYCIATGIIAQTEAAKNYEFAKTKHKNILVIGNPILKIKSNFQLKENIILNVGRFIPSKQQKLLIEIFSRTNYMDWKLLLLGDGPELEFVKSYVKETNLERHVIFAGNIKNIDDYYNRSKIFAFTSNSEGFPNVLGEAMSVGLACISFDCKAGPSELIENGKNGFLINSGNEEEYREKLEMLMNDDILREKLGEEAKEKVAQYGIKIIGQKYLDFILLNK